MTKDELQQFISWCKINKVKHFKNAEVEFELSELSFIESIEESTNLKTPKYTGKDLFGNTSDAENMDEDLKDLFWSTNP
jgi:hypothetical protein